MTAGASQEAIEFHYDAGRDFYRLWLDERMVYSCALWPDAGVDDDLETAQVAKLAWHARSAGAVDAARVLDVGCGWGALMRYLVEEGGVKSVTGLTLSGDQARAIEDHADARMAVRLENWQDHQPEELYDAIVSVGAFEHFTHLGQTPAEQREVYSRWFSRCASWLVPGGRLSLQTIGYEDPSDRDGPVGAFFSTDIFPESQLPNLSDIVITAEPHFRVSAVRSDAVHYEHTLHLWQQRLEAAKDQAIDLVGRDVYRRYLRYLRVSRAMFDRGVSTLYRVSLQRRPD